MISLLSKIQDLACHWATGFNNKLIVKDRLFPKEAVFLINN
jgi:hypothetical protein